MNSAKRIDNRVQEISEITRSLKIMAKELNIPVVTLAQLAVRVRSDRSTARYFLTCEIPVHRAGRRHRAVPVPRRVLRERGGFAEDVDKNSAEVIVAKNRHGDLRSVPLHWQGEFMRFTSQEVVRHES